MGQPSGNHPDPINKKPFTRANALELYQLARDEELRRLEDQHAEVDSMRQRAAQYLAFVGAATAFLAGSGLKAPSRDMTFYFLAGFASIVSLSAVFMSVAVLLSLNLPRMKPIRWSFRLRPGALLAHVESDVPRPDETDLTKYVTTLYAQMSQKNRESIKKMQKVYITFLALGALQVIAWTALVWMRA